MTNNQHRRPPRRLTSADAAIIEKRLREREFQNRIASDFGVNPGRVSEVNTGKRFAEVPPAV